jgi:hypothetical protein
MRIKVRIGELVVEGEDRMGSRRIASAVERELRRRIGGGPGAPVEKTAGRQASRILKHLEAKSYELSARIGEQITGGLDK